MKSAKTPALNVRRAFPPHAQHVAFGAPGAAPRGEFRRSRLSTAAVLAAPGGLILRINSFLSAFAASLIAFAPMHAFAQDRDESVSVRDRARPEYDPLGKRFGGFNLNASLDFGVASTDNLFAEDDAFAQDDMIYTAGANARLSSNWTRHALSIEGGVETTSHQDFSSEDSDAHYLRGVGRLDVGSNTRVTAIAGIAHQVEPRTDPDSPLTLDPIEYDRTDTSIGVTHAFNRFLVTGEVARSEYSFDGTQSFRDNTEDVLRGRVEAEITPRLGAVLEASTDQRDYDNAPGQSSEGSNIRVGATINFTDLMKGEITVGQFQRDYDSPVLGSTDGLAVASNLEWYVTRLTTLTFHARRNAEDVIGGAYGLPYIETEYGARVDHELLRNVILSGGARFGTREYDVVDRDDDFTHAEVGADYLMNRRVAVRARYTYDQVDSSGAAAYRDFEVNALSLGLSLRL